MTLENVKKQIQDKILDLLSSGVSHFPKLVLSHEEKAKSIDLINRRENGYQSLVFMTDTEGEEAAMVKNLLQKLNIFEKSKLVATRDFNFNLKSQENFKNSSQSLLNFISKKRPKKILCFGFQALRQIAVISKTPVDILFLEKNSKLEVLTLGEESIDILFLPELSELLLTPKLRKPVWGFLKKEYENSD